VGKYKPEQARAGVSLDEVGIKLGMQRVPEESLDNYRKRLALQAESRPSVSERDFINTISRSVGLFEDRIFEIDLVLDGNGESVAPRPRIEVTSSFIRVWSNYGTLEPELEVDIYNRGQGYHLGEVYTKLDALSFITVAELQETPADDKDSYKYKRSWFLKCGNTDRIQYNYILNNNKMNNFYNKDDSIRKYIHNCLFSNGGIFLKEKTSHDSLSEDGDYYVDYTNGIVFSYNLARGSVSYEYDEFPYTLKTQPVKVVSPYDPDIDHLKKDYLIDDSTGKNTRLKLNSYGAKMTNSILKGYPLQWGE